MARYHIQPETGVPGLCRAKKACPFGSFETDHYSSVAAAQAAYETKMTNATIPAVEKHQPQSIAVADLMDLELLARMRAEGFIDMRAHDDDEALKVMCYSKTVQYTGTWNEVTKTARGLIVRSEQDDFSDAVVVERPWRKFFTLEQHEAGWSLGDEENPESAADNLAGLDFNARAEVTDKMDGSLGILYRHPDGGPALATKGSFGSEQANYYTRMIRNSELGEQAQELIDKSGDKTFLFELVGKDNRIVLDYQNDGVVLLGTVDKVSGIYGSANDYEDRWTGGVTETMQAATVADALALPDRPEREGVVIRVLSDDPAKQMQLKVKQEDYKILHRAMTGFSKSDMRESIRDSDENLGDLLRAAETNNVEAIGGVSKNLELIKTHKGLEHVVAERRASYEEVLMPRLRELKAAKAQVDALPEDFFKQDNPAKAFAASIAGESASAKPALFNCFQARLTGRPLESFSGKSLLRSASQDI